MSPKLAKRVAKFAAGVVDPSGKFATGVADCHRWCTLTCEYLREFSKKIETVLMGHSGAGGKLIHKNNQKQKSRDTVPLNALLIKDVGRT